MIFHVEEHSLLECPGALFKATGRVILTTEVGNLALWDQVVKKLDGLPVYSATTLAETLVEAVKQRTTKALEDARVEIEQLKASVAFEIDRNDRLTREAKDKIQELQQEVDVLR